MPGDGRLRRASLAGNQRIAAGGDERLSLLEPRMAFVVGTCASNSHHIVLAPSLNVLQTFTSLCTPLACVLPFPPRLTLLCGAFAISASSHAAINYAVGRQWRLIAFSFMLQPCGILFDRAAKPYLRRLPRPLGYIWAVAWLFTSFTPMVCVSLASLLIDATYYRAPQDRDCSVWSLRWSG